VSIRVPRQKIEALFKIVKFDKRQKRWKRKAEASRRLGISRPTIDKILNLYPEGMPLKPKKMTPKYFEDFKLTEIADRIKRFYWNAATNSLSGRGEAVWRTAREASHVLKGKDLIYADEDDYTVFWGTPDNPPHPDFVNPQTNKLEFHKATALRMCMKLSKRGDLADDPKFTTKGLKREAGRKKKWYLSTEHIIRTIAVIKEVDTLILFLLGILFGGRFSALSRIKVSDIDYEAEVIDLYEPKVRRTVEKYLPTKTVLELLRLYIDDFNIKKRLFKWGIYEYNKRLLRASVDAGLPFRMSTHILKHTAITQMSLHGVDIDVISDYVGTEAGTIVQFYRGGGEKKIMAQIRGEEYEFEKWSSYIERLMGYVLERYNYIKPMSVSVDGIKLKRK